MKKTLDFEPLSKMFYVADSVIAEYAKTSTVPVFELSKSDYERLGCPVPADDALTIGFLAGRSGSCYSIDRNYALALAKLTGFKVRLLTYEHCVHQLYDCNGLVLPGGAFDSPESYYTDPRNDVAFPSLRSKAYAQCIHTALDLQIPILGICAGAQMVAGAFELKMYRSFDYIETPIEHYTKQPEAHRLNVFSGTPLQRIFGGDNLFYVNSRHRELLVPIKVQRELWAETHKIKPDEVVLPLDIYAEANDGTPEAWGSEALHILCVQWHPEDMAAAGNEKMQRIYQWLADEIRL